MGFQSKAESKDIVAEQIREMECRLKELSFSYEKLGKTLMDMPETQWELTTEEIYSILGRISLEVCDGCSVYYECYKQRKEETLGITRKILCYLEQRGTGQKDQIKNIFSIDCRRKEAFLEALFQSYEIVGVQRRWKNKMLAHRKMMAVQMQEMGHCLFEQASWLTIEKREEKGLLGKLRKGLREEKVILEQARFLRGNGRKKELYLAAKKRGKGMGMDLLARRLGEILHLSLVPGKNCPLYLYNEKTILHFKEDVEYQMLTGVAQQCKAGERESGDLYSIFRLEQGKLICLLADGMGSGRKAREESRRILELMEQLLMTGFQEESSFRLTNGTLTYGLEPSMFASLDLLSVNLYTGLMKIMKSGSAATFLVRRENVEILQSGSLPAGFFLEGEFDVIYKKLYDGDRVVLVSDGILEGMKGEAPEEDMKETILLACRENPQKAAEQILDAVQRRQQNQAADDMTVVVLAVWKKRRQK